MAIIYCRQPTPVAGGPWTNPAEAGDADGSEAKPYAATFSEIVTELIAGNTVRLHPTYYINAMGANLDTTAVCGGSGGVLERWDVPGYGWVMPTFCGLEFIPTGAWVETAPGSGNWRATFDGTLGLSTRITSVPTVFAWWGVVEGANDVRKDQLYVGASRRVLNIAGLSLVGDFVRETVDTNTVAIVVKTGGVNPTELWGTYCVSQAATKDTWRWTEVQNLTLRQLAFWSVPIRHVAHATRAQLNNQYEDCYHLLTGLNAIGHEFPGVAGVRTRNLRIYRPTVDSGYPLVQRPDNIDGESGATDGFSFLGGVAENIKIYDPRVRGFSHSAWQFVYQNTTAENGLNSVSNIRIYCKNWSTPGDGHGQYNTLDCGPADYQRGMIMLGRNWYVGRVKIGNQSVQCQISGSGIFSAQFPPGMSRPYSTVSRPLLNTSNGINWQGGSISDGNQLIQENIEIVGAVLDATGNCAAYWPYNPPGSDVNSIKIRHCFVYDPGNAKRRPVAYSEAVDVAYPNTALWSYSFSTSVAGMAPILHYNTFVKTNGGSDVFSIKAAGISPDVTGGGMTSYTAAGVNGLNGTAAPHGVFWDTKGNEQFSSLAAAGFNAQGQKITRRVPRLRGSSARGY